MTFLLQTKNQPLEHIGTPMLVCPSQTVCQMRNFDNFRFGAFLSIYDTLILIECCQYTREIRPVYTWNTHISVRVCKTMENSIKSYCVLLYTCNSNLLWYFIDISSDCM